MPLTPVHISFNIIIYYLITQIFDIKFALIGCLLLISAELIDLDHLFSKPIYKKRRNPFKVHYLHKNWKLMIIISLATFFFYPIRFLGLGIISHLTIDWIYTKYLLKL